MPRVAVLGLLALLTATPAPAQDWPRRPLQVGVVFGYANARYAPKTPDITRVTGAYFGFLVTFPVLGPFAFEPQVVFTPKGGGAVSVVEGVLVRVSLEPVYVELPLLAVLRVPLGSRIRPRLFAGPAPSVRLGCDFQFIAIDGGDQTVTRQSCQEAQITDLQKVDLGWVWGGGVDFRAGQVLLRADVRLVQGLRDVSPSGAIGLAGARNHQWVAAVGFAF